MGRRKKATESCLEFMEDLHWQVQSAKESYYRLARIVRDQLVIGECLERLADLGEEIQALICYIDYGYRHPEKWPVYMDEREKAALERLVRRN